MSASPRNRVVAAVLSVVAPGLGQVYLGQRLRGFAFFAAAMILPTLPALVVSELGRGTVTAMMVVMFAVAAAAVIDAYRFCKPAGTEPAMTVVAFAIGF